MAVQEQKAHNNSGAANAQAITRYSLLGRRTILSKANAGSLLIEAGKLL
jgi:hypothetical protein